MSYWVPWSSKRAASLAVSQRPREPLSSMTTPSAIRCTSSASATFYQDTSALASTARLASRSTANSNSSLTMALRDHHAPR